MPELTQSRQSSGGTYGGDTEWNTAMNALNNNLRLRNRKY